MSELEILHKYKAALVANNNTMSKSMELIKELSAKVEKLEAQNKIMRDSLELCDLSCFTTKLIKAREAREALAECKEIDK